MRARPPVDRNLTASGARRAVREDASCTGKGHSAANLALLRRAALNLLRRDTGNKLGLRRRKLRAMLNDDYRARLLFGEPAT